MRFDRMTEVFGQQGARHAPHDGRWNVAQTPAVGHLIIPIRKPFIRKETSVRFVACPEVFPDWVSAHWHVAAQVTDGTRTVTMKREWSDLLIIVNILPSVA